MTNTPMSDPSIGPGVVGWLGLAAAPTFAVMALSTAALGGQPDTLCGAMANPSPIGGMTAMYLLMTVFHAGPWARWVSRRWRSAV